MRLPRPLHPWLLVGRHLVAQMQRWWFFWLTRKTTTYPSLQRGGSGSFSGEPEKRVTPEPLAFTRHTPLPQPDRTTCGSCVLVMMRLLADRGYAATVLGDPDPVTAFGRAALATRRRTSSAHDRQGRLQLPWPPSLGTRPAALVRHLGGDWVNRVVDPRHPGRAWEAMQAAGRPVPLFVGEGSWMQHIVLVTGIDDEGLTVYDPACGHEVRRTRADFETARLHVAGWDQPWLVILPRT